MNKTLGSIAILGAGAFGTALALYLARRGQAVRLWSIDKTEIAALLADCENKRFLPGFPFPETLAPTYQLADALSNAANVLMAVPSVGYRHVLSLAQSYLQDRPTLISATKGIDAKTGKFLNDLITEILGDDYPFAVLAGPSFARELAQGFPTAVILAAGHQQIIQPLTMRFDSAIFRVYPSDDVIGVEVGSVLKNVIAIACGISDGMGFAANTQSAIITLGLDEISRLGLALQAKKETFMGLSGMGDLILTCSDNQSRNRRFGTALGRGLNPKEAEAQVGHAIEGKQNAELVVKLAHTHHTNMPICETVQDLLTGKLSTQDPAMIIERFFSPSSK